MKLLIFIPNLAGGGAERIVSTIINGLSKKYECTLLLLNRKEKEYPVNSNVTIKSLNKKSIFPSIPKIYKEIKNSDYDVIISNMHLPNIVIAELNRRNNNKSKLILIDHSILREKYLEGTFFQQRIPYLVKKTYKYADKIIAVSKQIKHELVNYYNLPHEKIEVIYNPIVDSTIKEKSKYPPDLSTENYIIAVGRLVEVKNFELLIKAFKNITRYEDKIKLKILGEGPLKKKLLNLIKELDLEKSVELMGFQKNPYPFIKQAEMLVLTSNNEGLPTVIVEAMALGIPIVSTDCLSGPREILSDGYYGDLVPVGDIGSLSQAILKNLKHPLSLDKKKSLVNRANYFSVEKANNSYVNLINKVVKK